MIRFFALLLPFLLVACGGAFPDSVLREPVKPPLPPDRMPVEARFAVLDANHDFVLQPGEVEGHWTELFDIMDADGDGRISAAEFMALPNPRMIRRDIFMEMNDPRRYAAFLRVDMAQQGYLTLDEFQAARAELFVLLDRNGDGVLSPEELGIAIKIEPPSNTDLRLPPPAARTPPPSHVSPAPVMPPLPPDEEPDRPPAKR